MPSQAPESGPSRVNSHSRAPDRWRAWRTDSRGRRERERYLRDTLGLTGAVPGDIRYQLLHRTASPLIEARRLGLTMAVMIVHAFPTPGDDHFEDFATFARELFGREVAKGQLVRLTTVDRITLWAGWADAPSAGRSTA